MRARHVLAAYLCVLFVLAFVACQAETPIPSSIGDNPPLALAELSPVPTIAPATAVLPTLTAILPTAAPRPTDTPRPEPTAAPTFAPTAAPPSPTPVAPTPAPTAERISATGEVAAPPGTPSRPVEAPEGVVLGPLTPSRPVRTVALDPGHGGAESGAAGSGLTEKDLNLQIALKLAALLRADGYRVVLTRDTDRAVSPLFVNPAVRGQLTADLQARIDIANRHKADLFLSIHNNGSADPGQSGTEVWYNAARPFSDRNLALARLVQAEILRELRTIGYPAFDRGIKDDATFRIFQGRAYNIYILGPGGDLRPHEPTLMPAVLAESLIVSNPGDAAILRQERGLDAIARGYFGAIRAYFAEIK